MTTRRTTSLGFTLIELLITIVLLIAFLTIGVTSFRVLVVLQINHVRLSVLV